MSVGRMILIAAAALAAAVVAYAVWSSQQKKIQQQTIAELVEVGAKAATAALQGEPSAELAATVRQASEKLPSGSGRQRAMALAADQYLATCRAIIERRVDSQKLLRQAAQSRNELNAHMRASASRNNSWIQRATELKRRSDQDHTALERSLTALADLLESLREPEKTLVAFMDGGRLVPAALRDSAAATARAEARRAADRAQAFTREEAQSIERFNQK